MASPNRKPFHDHDESGYASASSSTASLPDVFFAQSHLDFVNIQLSKLEPEEILKWALITLPSLFQTTAFGLTGLATLDMLSHITAELDIAAPPPLIFLDTLHHFPETQALVSRVQERYSKVPLHVYTPENATTAENFAARYGDRLWEVDDERYDFLAKVEPAQRAYRELGVRALLTGRRRSQGGARGTLPVVEISDDGLIKINPLANWSFGQVKKYIDANNVPYNELLDRGYKSVGDWHSTSPVAEGEDERAGRWKGRDKTECGIHNKKSRYAQFLEEQERKEREKVLIHALEGVTVSSS
ncbi:phosphoadenosine phosphosulfate reductase [Eremomyces bilateralis CBS 781.70]|uniref:phosphoadenylyl-sulfate reductase (thioredoxin) n=1 Tax=Eremomyces bilateralis CBS 781.70 TaxID=1392243 RepID=A0A6G1GDL2_9PEZI|nr:phosphoadenosine phosphosulfate reductase [Eremomyces bilateralis CBS 781.70]KAF1815981.1 phosphoadenosine phosphosulfate reductase [Eremomyces bilateralis CBS 781.70]